ncbi:AraC family transcriptional regulator [Chitinophaga sp. GbtcB8]|uniref:AraC family transcriptional regulator n=1 Tax=Chitinophaga sp. GbtcB8 TaxID=2824753 RepID=UPI001C2F85A3|nr:AraC family transcriptional regulator [Chitinophaga sp. GbtcB8]
MRPALQKLPLDESTSFVAKTFRTPHFEVGWHQHIEYELILFTEGAGQSFVGNQVEMFETGDIYFLGSNLPHTFQKWEPDMVTSAVVVQFKEDFWGEYFLQLPESKYIRQLLDKSFQGLKMQTPVKEKLAPLVKALEYTSGFKRILLLGECLEIMATQPDYVTVSTQTVNSFQHKDRDKLDRVFQFTIDTFRDPITVSQAAHVACMSVPAFCNYFKRCTKKTYIDFLNEVRIGYACNLLRETQKTVLDICYESGYNTMANFHKQFRKIKQLTPLQYRKLFADK